MLIQSDTKKKPNLPFQDQKLRRQAASTLQQPPENSLHSQNTDRLVMAGILGLMVVKVRESPPP